MILEKKKGKASLSYIATDSAYIPAYTNTLDNILAHPVAAFLYITMVTIVSAERIMDFVTVTFIRSWKEIRRAKDRTSDPLLSSHESY